MAVLAKGFDVTDDLPLLLALNPEGCIFRAHTLAALDCAAPGWREPYLSTSPTTLNIPAQIGDAVDLLVDTITNPPFRNTGSTCASWASRRHPELRIVHGHPACVRQQSDHPHAEHRSGSVQLQVFRMRVTDAEKDSAAIGICLI